MDIRYFKSGEKGIKVTPKEGQNDISVPEYVDRARKRFSFNPDLGLLNKQCSNCLNWFQVAKLTKDEVWEDTHDEREVHFDGKAYRSDCNHCYQLKKSEKAEKAEKQSREDKSEKSNKPLNSNVKKVSVFLSTEDLKYLKICAAYFGTTIGNVLSEIIAKDRSEQKFNY